MVSESILIRSLGRWSVVRSAVIWSVGWWVSGEPASGLVIGCWWSVACGWAMIL